MDPQIATKLQKRLESLGSKLSPEVCKELRDILQEFANAHYEMRNTYDTIGEAFKMAVIHLIPGKTQSALGDLGRIPQKPEGGIYSDDPTIQAQIDAGTFKPATKQNKGNPLAELLHNMSEADKAKLVGSLETNLKKK